MERHQVYAIIDAERDHQDRKCKESNYAPFHTVEAEIIMMEHYIQLARTAWINNSGCERALEQMRKAIAIGVRCFEHHGKPVILPPRSEAKQ